MFERVLDTPLFSLYTFDFKLAVETKITKLQNHVIQNRSSGSFKAA